MRDALLFRPRPQEDELFSSWLVRLAWANTQKLHSFTRRILPRRHHWHSDLDVSCSYEDVAATAQISLLPFEEINRTTLREYESRVFERLGIIGPNRWLMQVGKYGRYRLRYAQQFCRACLASDQQPYFRRKWRLAFSVVCVSHGTVLSDCCGTCGATVAFHQFDYGKYHLPKVCPITICWSCKADLRDASAISDYSASYESVAFQSKLELCLEHGFSLDLPGADAYGLLFFNGLHRVARIVSSPGQGGRVRQYLQSQGGALALNFRFPNKRNRIEDLRVGDRVHVMDMARRLLMLWPSTFIEVFRTSRVTSSYVNDVGMLPYWLASVVRQSLFDRFYAPTEQERLSVKEYLSRIGESVNENQIRKWLGVRFNSNQVIDHFKRPSGAWNSRRPQDQVPCNAPRKRPRGTRRS